MFKIGDKVTINRKTMTFNTIKKFDEIMSKHGGYLVIHSFYDEHTGSLNFDKAIYGERIGGSQGWISDRFELYIEPSLFQNDDFLL